MLSSPSIEQTTEETTVDPHPPRYLVEGTWVTGFPNPQSLFERVVLDTREAAATGRQTLVHYLNVHVANTAYWHKPLQRILQASPLVYCDGAGVVLGARFTGQRIPVRLTAADWFVDMLRWYARAGLRVFLLGSAPGVPEAAMRVITRELPEHTVVGAHHGHIVQDRALEEQVVQTINRLRPDILIVGFGTPLQELWIEQQTHRLKVTTVYGIGAVLDFISGHVKRCPLWMRNAGLEWLFRFYAEPCRLMGRYLIGNPWFLSRMALRALRQAISKRHPAQRDCRGRS